MDDLDFNSDLLDRIAKIQGTNELLPNEYKQCWYLWQPVYDEYIRIGFRLPKDFKR